jgi:hypothetical protein
MVCITLLHILRQIKAHVDEGTAESGDGNTAAVRVAAAGYG